jgi:hypothetical protein
MRRILLRAALVASAAAGLPGCVVSLFSDHTPVLDDEDDRLGGLERRMDEIERRLPPPPATPPTPAPSPPK